MTGFVYATMLAYVIPAVGTVAFLVWIGPSVAFDVWILVLKPLVHPANNELVERLFLMVEEMRERNSTPGRHRAAVHGVHTAEETFFTDLIDEWKDDHRGEITLKRELVNV